MSTERTLRNRPGILRVAIFAVLLLVAGRATADIAIAAWNIQHLGWGESKDYEALAIIGSHFDFIAVQEVMNEEGIQRMEAALEEYTGESWSQIHSHAIGRGSYREHYAFVWRDSAVEYVDGAVVYTDGRDTFAREPYSARFRSRHTGQEFAAANIHVIYGDSKGDRIPEILYLARYWDWLAEVYPDTPRVLLGDFNMNPGYHAWEELRQDARKLIRGGGTTISPIDGRFPNTYDNIIVSRGSVLDIEGAGIFRFPDLLGIDHEAARDHVSDHVPVFVLLGEAEIEIAAGLEFDPESLGQVECVDLNAAPEGDLTRLMHIGEARAEAVKAGRPWDNIEDLTRIRGIGDARVRDIQEQGLVCD